MNTKNTDLAWRLSHDRYITGPESELIADCFKERPEDIANAAFIVRACNAHDDLVAACNGLLATLNIAFDRSEGDLLGLHHNALCKAKAKAGK